MALAEGMQAPAESNPETSFFIRTGAESPESQIALPIVLDAADPVAAERFKAFIDRHKTRGNIPAAAEESQRLASWFAGYGKRLQKAIDGNLKGPLVRVLRYNTRDIALRTLATPGNLSQIFQAQSGYTRNTFLSSVVIVPGESFKSEDSLLKDAVDSNKRYNVNSKYNGYAYGFGFMCIAEKDGEDKEVSSVCVPTLALNAEVLKKIAPHGGLEIMQSLQDAITLANHDVLHNYTVEYIRGPLVGKHTKEKDKLRAWLNRNFSAYGESSPRGYEGWANLSQARSWTYLRDMKAGDDLKKSAGDFIDSLSGIARALEESGMDLYERHKIVDYLGTAMIFTLARIFPLDDPMITDCLKRLETIDPCPEAVYIDEIVNEKLPYKKTPELSKDRVEKILEMMVESGEGEEVFKKTLDYMAHLTSREDASFMVAAAGWLPGLLARTLSEGQHAKIVRANGSPLRKSWNVLKKRIATGDTAHEQLAHGFMEDLKRYAKSLAEGGGPETKEKLDYIAATLAPVLVKHKGVEIQECPDGESLKGRKAHAFGLENAEPDYLNMKLLQAGNMLRNITYLHTGPLPGSNLEDRRNILDNLELDMIHAVAEDLAFKPEG